MRKTIFIIFIILFGCNAKLKYLNKFDGYKDEPKKVEETSYSIDPKDSLFKETYRGKIIMFYDTKGRKTKALMYNSENSISMGGTHYNYDQQGNMTESILYNIDSTINSKHIYKYNNYGQQIEHIHINGNDINSTTKSNFDRQKRTEEIMGKHSDGSFKEYTVQRYDKNWNVSEVIGYDSTGKQEARIEFEYDADGNKNSSKWYNTKDELYNFSKTIFNKHNHPIEDYSYNVKGVDTILKQVTRMEYKYYPNNNIKERKYVYSDKLIYILRYKYNY